MLKNFSKRISLFVYLHRRLLEEIFMNTTLNIHTDILEQIVRAAKYNKISASEMILRLIQKSAENITNPGRLGRMIQYQARCKPQDWHIVHIQVREDMYEYWLDLRKLLKMSISLILAYAVKKFLGKLMSNSYIDNYHFINYMIMKEIIDNVIIWKLIWGCPPNIEKLLH